MRIVHLGLGNFFRAHQAWYTANAPDAADWGIAAFTGRSAELADALTRQDGLYTLITRAAEGDTGQVLGSVSRAHPGTDTAAWLTYLADPDVRIVTLTITEAGYLRGRWRVWTPKKPIFKRISRRCVGSHGHRPHRACPPGGLVSRPAAPPAPVRSPLCPATTFRTTVPPPPAPTGAFAALLDPALRVGSTRTSRSSPPWSTGSPQRPRATTVSRRPT